jgi:EAL domain-containing protein (putative c-di-GMP-specific phosphodiesterase class I)
MYQAKCAGKNNVQSFTRELSRQTRRRLDVVLELRRAIDKIELELFYQPQIDLSDGRVVGFEALLRWQNQKYGSISPAEFIPIAEDTGLILPIGEWVLCQACLQTGVWRRAGKPRWQMAVNVSPHQFIRPDFVDTVIAVIGSSGIDPANLELEITESVVMHDIARVADKLNRLRELGVSIAIDDFGTGYSSLRYLQQLPIDKLKIDQSFMHDIKSEKDQSMLIDTFIMLSANLGFKVIAEGVETREQLAYLKKINCHQVQGFYFAKPMPATQAASVTAYALTAGQVTSG